MTPALEVYARSLAERAPLRVRFDDGTARALPLRRWLGEAGGAAADLLDRVAGPALEVGCGPGRHVRELLRRGVLAVGIDACPEAVSIARAGGALAIHGSVFDRVPGTGDWRAILLLDGSIGIGGDPVALLGRVAGLLHPAGDAWVELDPAGTPYGPVGARLEGPAGVSAPFRWARVAACSLGPVARAAGLEVAEAWEADGRPLARLVHADAP